MTAEQDRWPLTGHWHAGPWTYEVSERLRDHLNNLTSDARRHHQLAFDRQDWALLKQWEQYERQLGAYGEELSARDEAAREQWRWESGQLEARQNYVFARYSLWFNVWRRARGGDLASDWRDHLKTYLDEERGALAALAVEDIDALVIHEVETLPLQPWEPYVAGGDWRAALNAWYCDSIALHDWHYRLTRSVWDMPKLPMLRPPPRASAAEEACRAADAARCAALKHARQRDELEAWCRAGLAAGGDAYDWRGWYRRRIEETWNQLDEIHHPTVWPRRDCPFTLAGEAEMQRLPGYWTS